MVTRRVLRTDVADNSLRNRAVPDAREKKAGQPTHGNVLLSVTDLVVDIGSRRILDGPSFEMSAGEVLGVAGFSGSGKSVLMRAILGIFPIASGRVSFGLIDGERPRVGVLFQNGALFSSLTVVENVMLPILKLGLDEKMARRMALYKLDLVGLAKDVGELMPSQLSGGMTKRVALARALADDSPLIFLDEPTAGLDPSARYDFDQLLLSLQSLFGFAVFMITHDTDSLFVCSRVIGIEEGRLVATASPVNKKTMSTSFFSRYMAVSHSKH